MTTSKQARHSQFKSGQGAFKCGNCKRLTRDTGDNGQCELCPECYDLAGMENALSDNGEKYFTTRYAATARSALESLAKHIGERAYTLHPEIAELVKGV